MRLLDRMERDELIHRIRNQDDRRVYNFYLTPKAKKIGRKLEARSQVITQIAHESISKKDIEKLKQLITAVIGNLEEFLEKH